MATFFSDDYRDKIANRFTLVLLAAQRVRLIRSSKTPLILSNGSKLTVVALREIAGKNIEQIELENDLVESLQTQIESDMPEPALLMSEEELIAGVKGIADPEHKEVYREVYEDHARPSCIPAHSPSSS